MKDPQLSADFPVVVLISGRGSNFESLARCASHYRVMGVISNNREAKGISIAEKFSIPVAIIEKEKFNSLRIYREAVGDAIETFGITANSRGVIALAGFMEILKEPLLSRFCNKIINIHPSLLPDYPGLDTHSRVIANYKLLNKANDTTVSIYHGCTVHVVDAGVDTGSIIAQARCLVSTDDTPESLAHKVLEIEHRLYPWVVKQLAQGNIIISSSSIKISPETYAHGINEGFLLPNC
jgi:phosphoribosylglycinamide formyltransferase-1